MDERSKQIKNAESEFNKGWTLSLKAFDTDALKCFHCALEIQEHWLGKNHTSTAKTYYQIASCLHNQKRFQESLVFHRRAYEAWNNGKNEAQCTSYAQQTLMGIEEALKALGMNEESVTEYLDGLELAVEKRKSGKLYHERHDYEQATLEYEMALALHESAVGQYHPDTADLYCDLARVLHDLGDHQDAIEKYQMAAMIYRTSLGENHPTVAKLSCEIAEIHLRSDDGDLDVAEILFEDAYNIYSESLGRSHPDTVRAFSCLCAVRKEKPQSSSNMLALTEEASERSQDLEEILLCGCCQVNEFSGDPSSDCAPVMSRACGHSICKSCVQRLKTSKCPL